MAVGRALFVGAVAGFELAVMLDRGWPLAAAVAVVYAACVVLVGWTGSRAASRDGLALIGALNTLAIPFLVAGLGGLSSSTEIEVTSTGVVHAYPWLLPWIALGAAAALLVVLAIALRRRHGRVATLGLERIAVVLVAAPVGLFVLLADLPGELGTFNSFEEGQAVAGAELVRDGAFPWRDLMLTHGFSADVVHPLLGFAVFDESRWGLSAANNLLLVPLVWIGVYYLCAYLFWTNWVFLLGTQLLVVSGVVTTIEPRFLLVPFVFLLLAALLVKPSVPRATAFTTVLFLQVLLTPEALVVAVAALVALTAFELAYRHRSDALLTRYRRLALCLASAIGLVSAWAVFLAAFGALDDWGFALASVLPGHRYTGGIPLMVETTEFEVVAPVVAVLVVYAFVAGRVWLRRPFAHQDWLMVALGLFAMLYYAKFLSRADRGHLLHSFTAAVPLLFYLAFRGVTYGEALLAKVAHGRSVRWFPRRHALTVPLLVVLVVAAAPEPLYDVIDATPRHFTAQVAREPEVARIGYTRPGENDMSAVESLDAALDDLLEPGDTVFDFSNAPGLLHYLLDLPPSTRYYHVSFAIRGRSQSDLVRQLEAEPAGAVVVGTERVFNNLPAWDGSTNHVRHYEVSEHLLDEYVPVREVEGFVLLAPRESAGAGNSALYFRVDPCEWGYVPNFLSKGPAEAAQSIRLPMERSEDQMRFVVTLPPDADRYRWLEMASGAPLHDGRFALTDDPGGDPRRLIAFSALGSGERVVRVNVGACSQWRGYRPGPLYLTTTVPQDVDRIRLVR